MIRMQNLQASFCAPDLTGCNSLLSQMKGSDPTLATAVCSLQPISSSIITNPPPVRVEYDARNDNICYLSQSSQYMECVNRSQLQSVAPSTQSGSSYCFTGPFHK